MANRLANLVIPVVLAACSYAPAVAQVRVGVDLGAIHIRMAPDAPPPLQREVRMRRPSRNHTWVAGYWDRQDDRWAWAPGRWEESRRGSSWVKARYQRDGGGYRYEPGHWSNQRLERGEEYNRWHKEHGRGQGDHGRNDRDRNDRDRNERNR